MTHADELERLATLRDRGVISDDEFQQLKTRVIQGGVATPVSALLPSTVNRLRRSRGDRWIGGVCGGVALLTGMESWVWRLAFALLFLFWGAGLLLYILLWIFVPDE
ncbi:MAG TPA: PspC domain-containing protein [Aquabacterium sp.]|nr:PspC domain-containing protein [Aquabacterium sp.]HRH30060.1 PspC domain-containing protein [Aquabacterium sp.]